ncbi:MAG: hypothetical protein ACLSHC_17450 [Bilophila wadsworthia]
MPPLGFAYVHREDGAAVDLAWLDADWEVEVQGQMVPASVSFSSLIPEQRVRMACPFPSPFAGRERKASPLSKRRLCEHVCKACADSKALMSCPEKSFAEGNVKFIPNPFDEYGIEEASS